MRTLPELLSHDKVVGDRAEFLALAAEAQAQLRPEGFLELHFAAEIFRDTWRLNIMATVDESTFSEDFLETRSKYRDRLNTAVRRNTQELRRLQTDRILNERWNLALPAPASAKDVLRFEKAKPIRPENNQIRKNEPIPDTVQTAESRLHAQIEAEERRELAEFAQRTNVIPRNAPCPCKSGEKYKRCCGKEAPPVLNPVLKKAA
ncbi:MAG: SEC-C domain-containing protein [Acidobacteriia bacterium]|jgi:uncharacterized protein YecA (UPF0149 family)|nr:SEC-C domain-containing protein [Terriglobia bacterium]